MTHTPLPPFAAYSGSRTPKILVVGEAWGQSESELRRPFVGEAGKLLFEVLGEAMPEIAPELHSEICSLFRYGLAWSKRRDEWLEEARIGLTNVLAFRPPSNKIDYLCGSKKEVELEWKESALVQLGGSAVFQNLAYPFPAVSRALYLRPEYLPELDRLYAEISATSPNLVLALGNTACWAILRTTSIGSIRGSVATAVAEIPGRTGVKVLASYHPAAVLRMWAWRPILVADLMKAKLEAEYPEIRRPKRQVLVNPTLEEVQAWTARLAANPPEILSADIETGAGQIKCISFAPSISEAICIPFVDLFHPSGSYWPTIDDERVAWGCVRTLLELPSVKLWQNFIYDLQYISRMGILAANCTEDTMLLHHSMYPELQKGLGFLGSIYSNEQSWKLMGRRRADAIGVKADE